MTAPRERRRTRANAIRLAGAYLAITVAWILGSDYLAALIARDAAELSLIQNIKGLFFVTVMTLLVGMSATRLARAEAARQRALVFASTDPVTQLPNTRAFYASVADALAQTERQYAVMLIDFRDFARINATFGHQTGDQALFSIGRRLRALAGANGTVARLEEDKFAVLLPVSSPADATLFADRCIDRFRDETRVAGQTLLLTVNVGYALSDADNRHVAGLMDAADLALRTAKETGHNSAYRFSSELIRSQREHFHLEAELRSALTEERVEVHLQPQFALDTGALESAEALLRWTHPERGLISPAVFIPVAERSGLIDRIGEYVLNAACRMIATWHQEGLAPVRIAVNIAGHQLDDQRLGFFIRQAAKTWNVPLSSLEIEITESMAMRNPERAVEVLRHLRELGVTIALDDFGTGYSSLSYLLQLPVNKLKIDRSFIERLDTDQRQRRFVRALVALGHDLGMRVVAEGIETETQRELLRSFGCDLGQGFLLGHPMNGDAFSRLLHHGERAK